MKYVFVVCIGIMLVGCEEGQIFGPRGDTQTATTADTAEDTATTEDAPQDTAEDTTHNTALDVFEDANTTTQPDTFGGDTFGGDTTTAPDTADTSQTEDVIDPVCELGTLCRPIEVDGWPYSDSRDTQNAPSDDFDIYGCAPATDESGGEFIYRFTVNEGGILRAALDDVSGDAVDIDLHLLDGPNPDGDCVQRDNVEIGVMLRPGTYYLVADTWVNGSGLERAGAYTLTAEWLPLPQGACAMSQQDLRMFWTSCDPNIDCDDSASDGIPRLPTPATGPVVMEAHLVTTADDFGGGWPLSFTDGIDAHYAMSQDLTGFFTTRTQPWAPDGEGGSQFGQGSTSLPLPPEAEAWYVNMYWRDRPAKGTRMLLINPVNGRAVVTAAGYETGPGANTAIGGAVEEVHLHLGTTHRDTLIMGFMVDQSLPFGPIDCDW